MADEEKKQVRPDELIQKNRLEDLGLDNPTIDKENPDKRSPINAEQKEILNRSIAKLGEIFAGTDINWQLDGALNISLMNILRGGDYIGKHSDIDLSIEESDLKKLEELLLKKHYGLFLAFENPEDPDNRIVEPADAQKIREITPDIYLIGPASVKGKFGRFDKADLHLIRRDANGNPTYLGIPLPKDWFEARPITFEGQIINLSHPAKTAFFKINNNRPHDLTDLMILAQSEELSTSDVEEIERVSEEEGSLAINSIVNRAALKIKKGMSADQVYDIFIKDPVVDQNIKRKKDLLRDLSQQISEGDGNLEDIRNLTFKAFSIEALLSDRRQKIKKLRSWVEDAEELKRARADLENKFK